jgi:hypothetical protein
MFGVLKSGNTKARVLDPTLPGTFTFYQRAELNGNAIYSAQHTITVSCGAASSVIIAPAILALAFGETQYKVTSPASTYTLLGSFTSSNTNCGVNEIGITQISGGSVNDIQNLAGTELEVTSALTAAPVVQLPPITTVTKVF